MSVVTNPSINGYQTTSGSNSSTGYIAPPPTGVEAIDQATIVAAMAASAQIVYFDTPGTYILTGGLLWPANKFFVSRCGPNDVIFKSATASTQAWMFENITTGPTNVGATGITFDANSAARIADHGGTNYNAISLGYSTTVQYVTFKDCQFLGGSETTTMLIHIYGKDILFDHCTFRNTDGGCVRFGGCTDAVIDRCYFTDYNRLVPLNTHPAVAIGENSVPDAGCFGIRITNNYFNNTASLEFAIEATAANSNIYNRCIIQGNTFNGNNLEKGSGVSGAFDYSLICDNIWYAIKCNHRNAIEVEGMGTEVSNNTFYAASSGAAITSGADLIKFTRGYNSLYTGGHSCSHNKIYYTNTQDTSVNLIVVEDMHDVVIRGNYVELNTTGTGSFSSIIGLYAPQYNITIEDNVIIELGSGGGGTVGVVRFYGQKGSGASATYNDFTNCIIRRNRIQSVNASAIYASGTESGLFVYDNQFISMSATITSKMNGPYGGWWNNTNSLTLPWQTRVNSQSSNYTLTLFDKILQMSTAGGARTVTLPLFPPHGMEYIIKKQSTDANTMTIALNGTMVDGSITNPTTALTTQPVFRYVATRTTTSGVTMTIAAPCVVTLNAHGRLNGSTVAFTTSAAGVLPLIGGSSMSGIMYYVKNVTANTFEIESSVGGGSLTTTGSQSGTHSVTWCDWTVV